MPHSLFIIVLLWGVNCRACNDDDTEDKKTIESSTTAVNTSIYYFISGIANFDYSFHRN